MGYGSTILVVMLFVNILVYLGSLSLDNSTINSPIISTLAIIGGNGSVYELIPSLGSYLGSSGTVIGLIILGMVALSIATGSNYLTSGGGYGVVHAPMLIGLFMFLSLALVPNTSAMGFPFPIDILVSSVFGMMLAIGTYGIIRGE